MKQKLQLKGNTAMFKELSSKYKSIVEDEVAISTYNIADQARRNAPSNQGILRNSIDAETKNLIGEVNVKAEYAAYLEFGTGTRVDARGYDKYAQQFKGKTDGTFEEFKLSLKSWMKQKGIEEKYLFPIMMKILKVGIEPQPFLFPAFEKEVSEMFKRLKNKINASK